MRTILRIFVCVILLVLSITVKAQTTNRVPENVARTGELVMDPSAIVFVIDGCVWVSPDFTYEKLGNIDVEAIIDCFVKAIPFISKDDIDFYNLNKSEDWAVYAQVPKDCVLITTKEESRIKTFILNGKPTKRLRGIKLGVLLDEELLKQQIQKKWRIKSNVITGISIEGKTISITTK
jgi:hypothetical protein